MVFINDSLTVVLIGDWNKLYIQPHWVASNIYEAEEIEIGLMDKVQILRFHIDVTM